MGVNSLPKTVTRQRRGCDLNPGPSAPESSTLTTRLPAKYLARIDSDHFFPIEIYTNKLQLLRSYTEFLSVLPTRSFAFF